jgi:hypothetical protein
MVPDDDGVVIGRPDTGSYAVFPEEGAQVLRMLAAGTPVTDVAAWYEHEAGEPLEVADFLGALTDLGFLLTDGEAEPVVAPVTWQRLGRWLFSWPSAVCYTALVAAAVAAMILDPGLRPSYGDLFFTSYVSLIPVVTLAVAIPAILLHEACHALAGRRLGLPSRLGISRRFYYIVAETRMDSLLSVPRRHRYLPFLAGVLADVGVTAAFTLLSLALDQRGIPAWCAKLCLTLAFTCVLRLIWQCMLHLETDFYHVLANAFRCTDLQNAARFYLRARIGRLIPVRGSQPGEDQWSKRDRAMARWYAPILAIGYGFSLFSLFWAGIPVSIRLWSTVIDRFKHGASAAGLFDAAVFIAMTSLQIGLLIHVTLRDRRARTRETASLGAIS